MKTELEVLFAPAEYQARAQNGFVGCGCVVFDVLRATSVMIAGLSHGASGFIPVAEIDAAIQLQQRYPNALLAGERNGLRITAAQSGGVNFDLGNSPPEYVSEVVAQRLIITTTTNGTRALRACATARALAVGAFLNLTAVARWLMAQSVERYTLVCAGTGEFTALEDALAAGAICDLVARERNDVALRDSALMAQRLWLESRQNLLATVREAQNARRLLAHPELQKDVEFCAQVDLFDVVGVSDADGVVRRVSG